MKDTEQIAELFGAALELDPSERSAFVARECGGRPELQAGVEALLQAHGRAASARFLEESAVMMEARQIAAEPQPDKLIGQLFGRYRLVKVVGEGGMGEVYLAQDTVLNRQAAVKLIRTSVKTKDLLRRFHRERQILAQLNHGSIASVYDAGTGSEGVPFLVMEYVEGLPLTEYCDAHALSVSQRLELFRTVCSAVQHAHQNLVVHRDLKPSNILVTAQGEVKLLDFGIAKLLDPEMPGEAPGTTLIRAMTPAYASPEQINGGVTTTATDVYSLGVLLYELLTGGGPYKLTRRTTEEIVRAVCEQEPERPSTAVGAANEGGPGASAAKRRRPVLEGGRDALRRRLRGDLDDIVLKALRKEPRQRYSTVEQLSEDLRRHLEGLPVQARKGTFSYRGGKFLRRHRIAAAAAAVVLCTLVGGIITTSWEARVAERRFREGRKLAHSVLFDYHDAIAYLPGSTPARALLVTDALGYLDIMAKEAGGDTGLQLELASAYLRVGDVQGRPYAPNLGQTDGALTSYRKGLTILQTFLTKAPHNQEARRQVAMGLERVGNIELRKGQIEEAIASQRKAMQSREELLALDPSSSESRRDLAASYLYLGDVLQVKCFSPPSAECLQTALDYQQKALAMRLQLSRENPADLQRRREVAQAYMRVGFRLRDLSTMTHDKDMMRRALESHQHGVETQEDVAAHSSSSGRDRRDAADQRMVMSPVRVALGDYAGALAGYRMAIETFQSLSAADPANAEARRDLTFAHTKLATILTGMGENAAAEENFDAALAGAEQLLAADPASHEDLQTVSAAYSGKSLLAEQRGDLARAAEYAVKLGAFESNGPWYSHAARLYIAAAQAISTTASQQTTDWRAARDAARHSVDILQAQAAKAPLGANDAAILQQAMRDLAQCEASLAKAR